MMDRERIDNDPGVIVENPAERRVSQRPAMHPETRIRRIKIILMAGLWSILATVLLTQYLPIMTQGSPEQLVVVAKPSPSPRPTMTTQSAAPSVTPSPEPRGPVIVRLSFDEIAQLSAEEDYGDGWDSKLSTEVEVTDLIDELTDLGGVLAWVPSRAAKGFDALHLFAVSGNSLRIIGSSQAENLQLATATSFVGVCLPEDSKINKKLRRWLVDMDMLGDGQWQVFFPEPLLRKLWARFLSDNPGFDRASKVVLEVEVGGVSIGPMS